MAVMTTEKTGELSRLTRERRTALGLSVERAARASGDPELHGSWINRLELGQVRQVPTRPRLEALARALQLPFQTVARAAAQQFFGMEEIWASDRSAQTIVDRVEEMSEEDRAAIVAIVEAFARSREK